MLPQINELLDRVAREGPDRRGGLGMSVLGNGSPALAEQTTRWLLTAGEVIARFEELGIVLRDISSGLVDFPAERDGEPIYLCWRRGENRVDHWHDRESGFAGRQPI